jgi:cell division protein FtsL
MSTAAAKNYPAVFGSAARPLTGPKSDNVTKVRTPLSVVRSTPRKRRAPFVVLCFALLAIALIVVLVLNISVSTAQYQLVQLRGDQSRLTKQNQDLTQQVQNFEAPQNVAAKAAELGMVPSTAKGQIDLATLAVTGKAQPAAKGPGPGAVIAAPAVAGLLLVVPPATSKDPLASRKSDGGSGTNAPAAAPQPAPAAPQPAPAAPPAAAPPAAPAAELNGGSVPAPQQKTPGQ